MRCRFYAYEESQVGRSKKRKEDGCFPIIQHHRPCFQVLQITENQLRKVEALCSLAPSLDFRVPRPSMHMFFFFPPFIPTWLHTTLDHFEITGEDDYTGAAPSLSTIFPFPCRGGELGLVETISRRGASLLSRSFPGYHFPIIHNSIIRSWLIDLIGRRDLKRALYIAAC